MRAAKGLFLGTLASKLADNREAIWGVIRRREALSNATECLRRLLPAHIVVTDMVVRGLFDELAQFAPLQKSVETFKAKGVIKKDFKARLSGTAVSQLLFCYVAPRLLKPETIVETGVAAGWSSALFLYALHQNQNGHLFSIDIPPRAGDLSMDWTLPEGLSPGFLVPEELRDRWSLVLGDSRLELMPLLEKQKKVNVFCHDSDHTYQHMMWEYAATWPCLTEDGILVSDDIGQNTAFYDFATAMRRRRVIHSSNSNFGALRK